MSDRIRELATEHVTSGHRWNPRCLLCEDEGPGYTIDYVIDPSLNAVVKVPMYDPMHEDSMAVSITGRLLAELRERGATAEQMKQVVIERRDDHDSMFVRASVPEMRRFTPPPFALRMTPEKEGRDRGVDPSPDPNLCSPTATKKNRSQSTWPTDNGSSGSTNRTAVASDASPPSRTVSAAP